MITKSVNVEIDTPQYYSLIKAVKNERPWSLDGALWLVTGADRVRSSNYVKVELKEVVVDIN